MIFGTTDQKHDRYHCLDRVEREGKCGGYYEYTTIKRPCRCKCHRLQAGSDKMSVDKGQNS